MKKAITDSPLDPSTATLRELPEIDFAKYRVRRNPYASRILREGVKVVHDEPSPASLAEMPEADFDSARADRTSTHFRPGQWRQRSSMGRAVRSRERSWPDFCALVAPPSNFMASSRTRSQGPIDNRPRTAAGVRRDPRLRCVWNKANTGKGQTCLSERIHLGVFQP
jgi:hypothetical protein